MVTLMPCSYISAPRCGLIDKMIEPKVLKNHLFFNEDKNFIFFYFFILFVYNGGKNG